MSASRSDRTLTTRACLSLVLVMGHSLRGKARVARGGGGSDRARELSLAAGLAGLLGQSFCKRPFVIDLSCPFKDENREPIGVVRGSGEWLSDCLLNCRNGWHEPRIRHD